MLECSFGLNFFLKTPRKKTNIRTIYMRVTVNGSSREISTSRKWDVARWDQKSERATGAREDARTINYFLDGLSMKVVKYKNDLLFSDCVVTAQKVMDYLSGKKASVIKVLEEFALHNSEMLALVPREYAPGTHERYVTARSHVAGFIRFKFQRSDIEFRELNYEFVKDYEFYLKTVRECSNNTTLKYIANFKKIVLRAVDKEIIQSDPFKRFKGKKTKIIKKPLSAHQLSVLEKQSFSVQRLEVVRDIFVFQCYTGLAYIDVFNLKKTDVRIGIDGERWITTARQKTGSPINIPLLPKAIVIMERYDDHPLCIKRGSVLPVSTNQKMNAYLKEIADLCGFDCALNTHKARRTFGSTVTLSNDVPIHVVKEMLGHHSVKQTEEYALTEELSIGREMQGLKARLSRNDQKPEPSLEALLKLEKEIQQLKEQLMMKSK